MRNFLIGIILGSGLVVSFVLIDGVLAQTNGTTQTNNPDQVNGTPDIKFPVAELGGCKSEGECRLYCEKPVNTKTCLDFAEKHNLISEKELAQARKFVAIGQKGPGGCNSKESCESYCNDVNNIEECVAFAEKTGLMPPEELEEAKKVKGALEKGAKLPGNCRNKKECESYCSEPAHMEECIVFAEAAGFIPPDELAEAKKALEAIRKGAKPPPCRGRAECDTYCAEPGNFEECITFAETAGFVSPEEAAMARKTGGRGPGGCRGKDECDRFCEDENNFPTCLAFAEEHELISKEDAEMARKTGGKGPGGCKGKNECEAFCQEPANQEVCFNFAKEHSLISEEDLRAMEEGRARMMEGLSQAPPEVMQCLTETLGSAVVEGIKSGTVVPNREMGDKMRQCFEKMMAGRGGHEGGLGGGPGGGPGRRGGAGISVKTGALGLDVSMRVEGGIKSFTIQPREGSSYGGDVPNCSREFKAETQFTAKSFPLPLTITDCNDKQYNFSITSEGEFSQGGKEGGSGPPPGGMPSGMRPPGSEGGGPGFPGSGMPPGFSGPGGCRTPEECETFCRANPQECRGFGPQQGGGEPGQPPPHPESTEPRIPSEGTMPPSPEQFRQIMEQQIREETERQTEERMREQLSPLPSMAPEGMMPPPTETPLPAETISPPAETPPPAETTPSQPTSQRPMQLLLGTLLAPFVNLFNQ